MRQHDLHIVAIRRIRRDRIWGILSPAVEGTSGPVAGNRKPVFLWLWPARTASAAGYRGFRNLSVFGSGVAKPAAMVADWHRVQSDLAGVLQVQIPVH